MNVASSHPWKFTIYSGTRGSVLSVTPKRLKDGGYSFHFPHGNDQVSIQLTPTRLSTLKGRFSWKKGEGPLEFRALVEGKKYIGGPTGPGFFTPCWSIELPNIETKT